MSPRRARIRSRTAGGRGGPAPVPTGVAGWDALLITVAIATLAFVWRLQDLFPVLRPFELPTVSVLAALGLALFGPKHGRRWAPYVRHPIARLSGVLLMLMFLSVPGSLYQGLSFRFIFQDHLKTLLLAALLCYSVRSWKDVERLAIVQLIGAAIYAYVIATRFEVGSGGRLGRLLYYDANDIGLLLVCCLPFGVYFLRPGQGALRRVIAAAVLAVSLFTIVKSGSRGAFLGIIAVGLYLALAYRAVPAARRLAAVGVLSAVFLVAAGDQYWTLMESMLTPTQDYNWDSESGRRKVWTRGVGYMLDHPLVGVGVAAFPVAEGTVSARASLQEYGFGFKWSAAHNSFVQIGAEIGVLGLLAFIALLWVAMRLAYRMGVGNAPRAPPASVRDTAALGQALAGSLIGFCVVGFFLSHAYSAFLYSLLAMVLGLAVATESPARFRSRLRRAGPSGAAPLPAASSPPQAARPAHHGVVAGSAPAEGSPAGS
jgi:O-antigen ligase